MATLRTPSICFSHSLLIHTGQHSVHNLSESPKLLTTLPAPLSLALILRRTNLVVYTSNKKRIFYIFDLHTDTKCFTGEVPGDIIGLYWVKDLLLCRCRVQQGERFYLFDIRPDVVSQKASFDSVADSDSVALNVVGISSQGALAIRSTNLGHVIYYPNIENRNVYRDLLCHKGKIQCIALSNDGTLMATSSDKGTLIRIWQMDDEKSTDPIHTFRRGTRSSEIYSLAFSDDNKFLVATSRSPTVHIFSIHKDKSHSKNSKSFFGKEEKSFAKFKFENQVPRPPSLAAFTENTNFIWYISEDGVLMSIEFDPTKGGDAKLRFEKKLYESK